MQTATAPCSTGAEGEGLETAGHWGIARGEWKYGVEWQGWGMGVKRCSPQRGGDYLVTGARRHCRSGEPRCVSKSWSLLLRVWGRIEGARRCWLSEPHSARAPLVSSPGSCRTHGTAAAVFEPARKLVAGSKSGSGRAPAEWGFCGLNSFFSFCCWWCSPGNRSARHRFGACLPFGARGKSQSPPGGCSGR